MYGTRRFVSAFTRSQQLFCTESDRSSPCPNNSRREDPAQYYPTLLRLGQTTGPFKSGLPTKIIYL